MNETEYHDTLKKSADLLVELEELFCDIKNYERKHKPDTIARTTVLSAARILNLLRMVVENKGG